MEENRTINGTVVKLRTDYRVKDWVAWKRVDEFYSHLSDGVKNSEVLIKMTEEEFQQLLDDILTDEAGEHLSSELLQNIPIADGLPLLLDFFLVYGKLSNSIVENLQSSRAKVLESTEKLNSSKTNPIREGKKSSKQKSK